MRDFIQFEIVQDFVNALVERGLAAAHPGKFQRVADDVAVGAGMGADPNIVEHGKIWKQGDVLEGAADADFRDPVRWPPQDTLALQLNIARARLVESAQAVEERGLAGAVGSDQTKDLTLTHVERYAVQRNDAPEHDADVANRKQRRCSRRRWGLRHLAPHRSIIGPERPRQHVGSYR
ncbi:hypothetical protein GALL_483130 [mine drainage metagenome]|uniref:Uncharacterized protein n=1 Tax=mine drainage metagenome TaxID=410659 RepID=A0A1J5PH22_9ZZZZ